MIHIRAASPVAKLGMPKSQRHTGGLAGATHSGCKVKAWGGVTGGNRFNKRTTWRKDSKSR
jgi:hypothetical protein